MLRNKTQRRRFIKGTSVAMISGLAGCTGNGGNGGNTQTTAQQDLDTFTNEAGVEVGANIEAIKELAAEEGGTTYYTPTSTELIIDHELAAYNQHPDYPEINIEVITAGSSDLVSRVTTEYQADNVQADFINAAPDHFSLPQGGMTMELTEEMLPSLAGMPDKYLDPFDFTYAPHGVQIGGMLYNTNMVSGDPFDEWWDVVEDDQWFGENLGWDPSPNQNLNVGIIEHVGGGEDFMDIRDTVGREWVNKLKSQNPMWVDSHSGLARQCAAGQFPVCFTYVDNIGENPEYPVSLSSIPKFSQPTGDFVLTRSTRPNAALSFINWKMSQEGQETYAENELSILAGMSGMEELLPQDEIIAVESVGPHVEAFEELWNDVMGELSQF